MLTGQMVTPTRSTTRTSRNIHDPLRVQKEKSLAFVQEFIARTKKYDMTVQPRLNPFKDSSTVTDPHIAIHEDQTHVEERLKWALLCATLQFNTAVLPKPMRMDLFEALILEQSYLEGYQKPVYSARYFNRIWLGFKLCVKTDPNYLSHFFLKSKSEKKDSFVNYLLSHFPTFLHNIYRYAVSVLGPDSSAMRIISIMNQRSRILFPTCSIRSTLSLSIRQFWSFFYQFGGKLLAPTSSPRLSDEHKKNRVNWVKKWYKRFSDNGPENVHYCFLDEKWFYTTSRRNKYKVLPRAEFESEEEAMTLFPRLRSRHHAMKVMCMGIVAQPQPRYNFDGLIYMKRVSKDYFTSKNSYNCNIAEDYMINHSIKKGEWQQLFNPVSNFQDITIQDALQLIRIAYFLPNDKPLAFSYKTFKGPQKHKWIRLNQDVQTNFLFQSRTITTSDMNTRPLLIQDLILHHNVLPGTKTQKDCSCDLSYMLSIVRDIGTAIRDSFHWVTEDYPIFFNYG